MHVSSKYFKSSQILRTLFSGPEPHNVLHVFRDILFEVSKLYLISPCRMTFYFSFEVLLKLKPIQQISKEEELQIDNNQGGGTKIRTITSRFWLFWKLLYGF